MILIMFCEVFRGLLFSFCIKYVFVFVVIIWLISFFIGEWMIEVLNEILLLSYSDLFYCINIFFLKESEKLVLYVRYIYVVKWLVWFI